MGGSRRARRALRRIAILRAGRTLKEILERGDAVYRIERKPTYTRLVGLQGLVRKEAARVAK